MSTSNSQRLKNLQADQIQNKNPKTLTPNRLQLVKDKYFKEFIEEHKVEVSEHEAHLYHVLVDKRLFGQRSGQKISKTSLKKLQPKALKQLEDNNYFKGAITFIIHDPTLKAEAKKEPVKEIEQDDEVKSSIEIRKEFLNELTSPELKELLSELTGEDVKGNPKKGILIDEIVLSEYRKSFLEKFGDEPSDDMTAEQIKEELASA